MKENNDGLVEANFMQKTSALILPCLASLPIMVMPFIFGAVIDVLSVDPASATFATSAEISMIALASLLVSLVLKYLPPRLTSLVGLLIASAGHLISISSVSLDAMFFARGLAGFGEGLCMGIGFATLAQIRGGTKLLAYTSGVVAALSLCSFQLVPVLQPSLGAVAVFWFMLAVTVLCIPLVIWMPRNKLRQTQASTGLGSLLNVRSLALFIIAFLVSAGSNTLWLYFEQAGSSVGYSLKEIGQLGSVILVPTLLVPFVVNFIFNRTKTIAPILIACLLSGVSAFYYAKFGSQPLFAAVVISMAFLYVFLLTYIRVFSAHVDHTGRTTAAVGGADSLGMVIGPLAAAFTLNLNDGFTPLSSLGLLLNLMCIVPCAVFVLSRAARIQRGLS